MAKTISSSRNGFETQTVRIAESVAAELRRQILRADFPEGGMLPKQEELVDQFKVSYPSVREALRILETEGLITVRRGNVGGARVHRPDAASAAYALGLALQAERVRLSDLADALVRLEPGCVAMCAQRPDRELKILPALEDNLVQTRSALGDGVEFTQRARQFHDILVSSCGNDTVRLVVRSLVSLWSAQERSWAEAMTQLGTYFPTEDQRSVLKAHSTIAARIRAGDPAEAEHAARQHIGATQKLFLERFSNEVVDALGKGTRTSPQALF